MVKRRLALVSGTHGAKWAKPGTPFMRLLDKHGIEVLPPPEWSEDAAGFSPFQIFAAREYSDWIAGGYAFMKHAEDIEYPDRIYIAHSYGGNIAAFGLARADAVPIRRLITVGTPYRADMVPIWKIASGRIGNHIHICDPKPPFIEVIAQFFDHRIGKPRAGHPTANHVIFVPNMKHSRILDNSKNMVEEWENIRHITVNGRTTGIRLIDLLLAEEVPGERPWAV